MVPVSVADLMLRFLGTLAVKAPRPVLPEPWAQTWRELARPLNPAQRVFIDFPGAAGYAPFAYLPQVLAIAAGRAVGAGPLALLWLARAANALAAILVLSAAIALLPVGRLPALVLGLLPMALYEYASVSPDALIITGSFLLTAIGLRALVRGGWRMGEVVAAGIAGAVVCSVKPVYAPLLVISLPVVLRSRHRWSQLLALAAVIGMALGLTGVWFAFAAGHVQDFRHGTSVAGQLRAIGADPVRFLRVLEWTFRSMSSFYVRSAIGILGWLTIPLTGVALWLPGIAFLVALLAPNDREEAFSLVEVAWSFLMIAGTVVLIMVALYLMWTPVGRLAIEGVQGRYFLPVFGLLAASLGSLPLWRIGPRGAAASLAVVSGLILLECLIVALVLSHAYSLF